VSSLALSELALTPPASAGRTRVRVDELLDDGVRMTCGAHRFVVRVWPDDAAARRAAGLATRLLAVDLFDLDGTPAAELTAVWHRVPHTRPIPMAAAMAFLFSGVPTYAEAPLATDRGSRP
jgi:hypothetical protein